jgi:hypothetical protein
MSSIGATPSWCNGNYGPVCGSLLLERRRVLHARIVEAIERLSADRLPEQVERLAQHAFRGEVWDKAVAYSRQAGTKCSVSELVS